MVSFLTNLTQIHEARDSMDMLLAERRLAEKSLVSLNTRLQAKLALVKEVSLVQEVFQAAIKLLYENLSAQLGNIITEGLSIVFPDSQYRFIVEFVERRNTVEADLFLEDADGDRYHPLDAVGGGVADFVSLLLRITYIILSEYDTILFSDEPLRFVDRSRVGSAAQFIKKICADFEFQLLLVSHIPEMVECADTIYEVQKIKGVSIATKIKG